MPVELTSPDAGELPAVIDALRGWQEDGAPVPLHPGDLGWHWRFGAEATARATRFWSRDGEIRAVGLRDGEALLRVAIAPAARDDQELAAHMADDLADAGRGVLPAGAAAVEARGEGALREVLLARGWELDELWTPLVRDLSEPVPDSGVRIEVVTAENAEQVAQRAAVQRASFTGSTFSVERWRAMAEGPEYAHARCLLAYDAQGVPVATATVWSAGAGRPGLLEPVGAHRDHRGHGHGRAIVVAAQTALREMGASSATVCTSSANTVGVAAYRSAGFTALPEIADLRRAD